MLLHSVLPGRLRLCLFSFRTSGPYQRETSSPLSAHSSFPVSVSVTVAEIVNLIYGNQKAIITPELTVTLQFS